MKIDSNSSHIPPSHNTLTDKESMAADSVDGAKIEPAGQANRDSITISDTALLVDRSSRANDVDATFDAHRVAELKSSIQTGHYMIDPERVAEKLHQFTMSLQ